MVGFGQRRIKHTVERARPGDTKLCLHNFVVAIDVAISFVVVVVAADVFGFAFLVRLPEGRKTTINHNMRT